MDAPNENILWFGFFLFKLDLDPRASAAIWSALLISLIAILMRPNVTSMRMFFVAGILRSIYSVGLGPTLWLMGAIQVEIIDLGCLRMKNNVFVF